MAVRVEGWLRVCSDDPETGRWQKRYCVLSPDERRFRFFSDPESVWLSPTLPVIRLDGSVGDASDDELAFDSGGCWQPGLRRGPSVFQRSSRSRLGVRVRASVKRSKSLNRRGDGAASAGRSIRDTVGTFPISFKIERGAARRNSVTGGSLRAGRSLDSIETYTSFGDPDTSIDLSIDPAPEISSLHYSIAPTDYCFSITLSTCVLFFSAPSRDAMRRWMERLIEPTQSDRGNYALTHDLSLRIIDGKGFREPASKSKWTFYCEIEKDGAMKGRTTSKSVPITTKPAAEVITWNELFEFRNLNSLRKVVVKVFKDQGRRRTKGNQGQLIGKMELDLSEGNMGGEKESWHKLFDAHGREQPCSVRLKWWFQSLTVLPVAAYHDLIDYVLDNPMFTVAIDSGLDMRTREELYTSLLHVLRGNNQAVAWIADMVLKDLSDTASENLSMIFRGNTMVTKCVECYMRQVSLEFLCSTLRDTITLIYDCELECEVDPRKVTPSSNLAANQSQLRSHVEKLWGAIYASQVNFPGPLRKLFVVLRDLVKEQETSVWRRLITGSFFLRFINPACVSPNTHGITRGYPEERVVRNLTLVAKVVQTLASETLFSKDSYMSFMNDFLEKERENMGRFLDAISTPFGNMVERTKTPAPTVLNPATVGESTSSVDVGVPRSKNAERRATDSQCKGESRSSDGFEVLNVQSASVPVVSTVANGKSSPEDYAKMFDETFIPQLPHASLNIGHDLAMLHSILHATLPKLEKTIWKQVAPLPFIVSGLQQIVDRPNTLLHPGLPRTGSLDRLAGMRISPFSAISSSIVQPRQPDERSRYEDRRTLPTSSKPSAVSQASPTFCRANSETALLNSARLFNNLSSTCQASPVSPTPPAEDVSRLSEIWHSVLMFNRRNNEPRAAVNRMTSSELASEVEALRDEVSMAQELFVSLGGCLAGLCEALDVELRPDRSDKSSSASHSRPPSIHSSSSLGSSPKPTLLQLSQEVRKSLDISTPTLSLSVAQAIHDRHMSDPSTGHRRRLDSLELANNRFAGAMEKHWKEFDGEQAAGDLLKINAALSSSKYHELTGAKPC